MKVLILALLSSYPLMAQQPTPKRLFIEERIKTEASASSHCDAYGNCYGSSRDKERNVSLEATREFVKKCPQLLTITGNREAADYVLRISPGDSTLYKANGDVAYISPTKYRVGNLAKDVCNYVMNQPGTP